MPRFEDFLDFLADGVPDPFDGGELPGGEFPDRFGESFQRIGCDGIRFCLEGILAVDIHYFGEQAELLRDIIIIDCHGTKLRKGLEMQ